MAIGKNAEALELLAGASVGDQVQLERALAAHASRLPAASAMADALARGFRKARTLGGEPELRDEAEFLLTLRGNPVGALALAQQNFASQRDAEDVSLLCRAARAAHRPQALRPLESWAVSQGLTLPPICRTIR